MKILYPGHAYLLKMLDNWDGDEGLGHSLQFVQRAPLHPPLPGTTNQEVCRALIDRVKVLNAEVPWELNTKIIQNLRTVILLHEIRAYQRHKAKEGKILTDLKATEKVAAWVFSQNRDVEDIPVDEDGHWGIE